MSRLFQLLTCIGLLLLVGCHAPRPSLNSIMPSARVAPPATGQHGSADTYYQQQANPAGITPSVSSVPAATDDDQEGPVSLANHQVVVSPRQGAGTAEATAAMSTPPQPAPTSTLRLRGMPVSDATDREPQTFKPTKTVREITPLSPPVRTATGWERRE